MSLTTAFLVWQAAANSEPQTSGYVFATGFYILDKGISNMPSREFRDDFVLQIITGSYPLFHQRFAFTCFCFVL